MKKITVKLKYDEVMDLYNWMGIALDSLPDDNFADKSVKALLYEWYCSKLLPKTPYRFIGKINFKLSGPTALAFAHLINCTPIVTGAYISGKLLEILGDVDQQFQ